METEGRVVHHESEIGAWELVLRTPDARLRRFVGDYQGYTESGSPAPLRQQVPTTWLPLIVNLGSTWEVAGAPAGASEEHGSFVAGLGERSAYVAATGPASCLQVNITPLGAHALLGLPMYELTNRVLALDDVMPRALHGLDERLEGIVSWEERFALVDAILLARMAEARVPSTDVAWAWRILERTHGAAPIGWICGRLGRSRRYLATSFHEQVGLPPKSIARIFRFERAVSLLGAGSHSLGEVAVECGYYDQAHLNRDFREFADASPGAFARRIVPGGGVLA